MCAGPKKALSLLRWGASGVPGPYSVERPQVKEDYNDGDRSLGRLWKDRPYSDVESPHPNADTDLDAEPQSKPTKRLFTEQVIRQAVIELVAAADQKEREREMAKHLDQSGAFSGPLWSKVAPYVNCVLDLMRMIQDSNELKSKLESSSVRKKELIWAVAQKAEMFGFGYRTEKKDWDKFTELVPAVTGMLKDEHNRELLGNALGEWAGEVGQIEQQGFAGAAPNKDDWGFKIFVPDAGGGKDTQEFYEGYTPGGVPRQRTYNVERIVALAKGNFTDDMVDGLRDRLKERMIVDFSTAQVDTQRLQAMMRYVTDQPDSQLALAIVVGTIVREAVRQVAANSEDAVEFENGTVKLNITPAALLSGMQGGTSRIIDEWLRMAVSIMRLVGVLPATTAAGDQDVPKYQAMQNGMRERLAAVGLRIATEAIQGLHDSNSAIGEQTDGGDDAAQPGVESGQRAVSQGELRRAITAPVVDLDDSLGDMEAEVMAVLESALDHMGDDQPDTAAQKARELHGLVSSLGASPASLASLSGAIKELMAMSVPRSASTTVADIAKRIVAPARMRVVTKDEAEEGVELGDGETLELPDRYHAAHSAIGGSLWASR